jgi:TrmH family RNA methyltransferase
VVNVATRISAQNPLLKGIRRAARRGELTPEGLCLAESFHLLEEAFRSNCGVEVVVSSESACAQVARLLRGRPSVRFLVLSDKVFSGLATTEASQGVLALVRPPKWSVGQILTPRALVVVLDGIQDPGNAGAILRAAEAFRASGLIFLKGTVNPYNPKAVRASAGSVFRVPLIEGLSPSELRASLDGRGFAVYATVPSGGLPSGDADFRGPSVIVIGSEGRGVRSSLRPGAIALHIPTASVESLNAAMAAGILLYEAQRQRSGAK